MIRGFTMLPNSVLRGEVARTDGKPLSHAARVLYALILHYSRYGERDCEVPLATLAAGLGCTSRHTFTVRGELEGASLIEVRRRGGRRTNAVRPLVLPERKSTSGVEQNQRLPT